MLEITRTTISEATHASLTLDVDWAPDFIIDMVANVLLSKNVKATWFITHDSPAVQRLRQNNNLFELGIHPNFLPGSSHGNDQSEIISNCMQIVPEARCLRSHSLLTSSPLTIAIMQSTSINIEASIYLPHANNLCASPFEWEGLRLWRIPFNWEDDLEMRRASPCWDASTFFKQCNAGLRIFNFHPIHIYLNSLDMRPYAKYKQLYPNLQLGSRREDLRRPSNLPGTAAMFESVVSFMANTCHSFHLAEIASTAETSLLNL